MGTQGLLPWPEHIFARSLIMSALYQGATPERQAAWRVELESMLEQLGIWARSCPANFAHKHALASGELARLKGRFYAAMGFYHQAAESAAAGGFVQWEGYACERTAALLDSCDQARLAGVYWQQAYGCYYRWGAKGKLRAMETACRESFKFDLDRGAQVGGVEDVPDQKQLSELLEKQLRQLRMQSVEQEYISLQKDSARLSLELNEAAESLRLEVAERKSAEAQLLQHREHLEDAIKQRTAELVANQAQLLAACDKSEAERVALAHEVAERKQAVDLLLINEDRLKMATRAGDIGIWDWDLEKNILTWDDSMYVLYGLSPLGFGGAYEAWLATLHPEDRQFCHLEIQTALRGKREYAPEFRIIRPEGNVRNIKAYSKTYRDAEGHPTRMIGVNLDITERKQAELALLASEEAFRATFNQAAVGISHVGLEGNWLKVNKKLCDIVGYSEEELLFIDAGID